MWCSVHPETPSTKAFCTVVFRYLLAVMKCMQRPFSMAVYILPTHDVRVMGLKLLGTPGSNLVASLPRRHSTLTFHCTNTDTLDQQALKILTRAGSRDGHFLKTQ